VWLDPDKTTPYQFYQFWLNVSDEDASKYIKIFTILDRNTIDELTSRHNENPQERILQKRLAEEVTVMVHSRTDYDAAVEASQILFGRGTTDSLKKMTETTFLSVFEGVPVFDLKKEIIDSGVTVADLCALHTQVFPSKGELRRLIQGGGLSINKEKIDNAELLIGADLLLNGKYLLVQKGKKNYSLIRVV
jgi:tyrosyl-tRNA synthetase